MRMFDTTRSRLRGGLLSYFFANPDSHLHLRDIASRVGIDPGNLSRELKRLCREGLFLGETRGRQKYFSLNREYPLYPEIKSIVVKTVGSNACRADLCAKDRSIIATAGSKSVSAKRFPARNTMPTIDEKHRKIVIIAGPNGAGKTTFAREYLPKEAGCPVFVNSDLIAAGLDPFRPDLAALRAGRIMLREIHEHVRRGESFAFETTLSGLLYARLIPTWRERGYRVKLVYLSLPNAEIALERVAVRVAQGGHSVPEDVVRRRYASGTRNFQRIYRSLVDAWVVYDNSGKAPQLIDKGENA